MKYGRERTGCHAYGMVGGERDGPKVFGMWTWRWMELMKSISTHWQYSLEEGRWVLADAEGGAQGWRRSTSWK